MKTFLELHDALLKKKPVKQVWSPTEDGKRKGLKNGLCYVEFNNKPLIDDETFQLFLPMAIYSAWWADEFEGEYGEVYNGIRQNIILFCAAINDEL